jgi:hypothetical protein
MKHIIFTISILVSSLTIGFSQDVPEVQQSLITKITATWCPNCGGWGWTFFENIYEDNADKALLIAAHYSGELQTSVSSDFADNFNISYQPFFILGNENQNVNSGNVSAKRTEIKNAVDNNYTTSPLVNAGLTVFKNGNTLNVQTKTRFFQDASGEYYLGVYVIEDGVVEEQVGQGDDAVHKKVMRASMSDSSFGELISSGSVSTGAEFTKDYSIDIIGWNENNLEIATILWKKEGDTYIFVNTHSTTEFSTVGVSEISEKEVVFDAYPTMSTDAITVNLDIKENIGDIQLELIDQTGQKIKTIYSGEAVIGQQTFELHKSMVKSNGLYFISLRSGTAVSTKSVIFQ